MFKGDTALHSAIRSFDGDIRPVKLLLEALDAGDDVNARNGEDETPLLLAVRSQIYIINTDLLIVLLAYGADVKATTPRDGNTALHWLALTAGISDWVHYKGRKIKKKTSQS